MELLNDEGVFDSQAQGKPQRNSDSSRSSAKRKSSDNDENVDSAQLGQEEMGAAAKKVRMNTTETSSIPASKLKSGLPRYQAQAQATAPTVGAGRKNPGGSLTPKAKAAIGNREKSTVSTAVVVAQPIFRPVLTEMSSPVPTTTPRKTQTQERNLESAITATPKLSSNVFIKKIQKELVSEVTGVYLSQLVDSNFASYDERFTAVNNSLKTKASNKWDVKERVKRLEGVIKDLRDIIVNMQDSARIVKESCTTYENKLCDNIRDVYDQLVDNFQTVTSLQSNDRKMRKEIENLQAELKQEASKLVQLKSESINQVRNTETKLLLTEKENERLSEKLRDLEVQFEKLNRAHEENLLELKQSQNKVRSLILLNESCNVYHLLKHNDEMIKVYQMEIATLQANQKRLETDFEKVTRDYEEAQRKNMEMMEALANSKSNAKDTEINKDILEREVNRLSAEVAQLKETVAKKDDDLRNSMQNVYEIQKQALEEKCTMRQEAGLVVVKCSLKLVLY